MSSTYDDVRAAFYRMWHEGYDGKDLAIAFVRVAANVVREERPEDLDELRKLVTDTRN
jgi:hypothetical protein